MRGFRFVSMSEKGRESLRDRILLKKGASKWEKGQFKMIWKVELVSDTPYTLDVIGRSNQLLARISPSVFLEVFKKELAKEDGLVYNVDYYVEVLK